MSSLNKNIHRQSYANLFLDKDYLSALEYIRERIFANKDLGISYRELNHWSTQELLFEQNETGKWRKFNILEIVWIELLKELRVYNLPLAVLKNIKISAEEPFTLDILKEVDPEEIKLNIKTSFPEEIYERFVNSEEFKVFLDNQIVPALDGNYPKNYFEIIILEAFFLKFQYRIIINYSGYIMFTNDLYLMETLNLDNYKLHFGRSNISVSINSLIAGIFKDYAPNELNVKWRLISEEENKILDLVQSEKKIKSINIRFSNDSIMDLLEYKEELRVSPSNYLKDIMLKGGYEEIKIVTQKGNIVVCERTVKEKINKSTV